ncbi:hypothetical protein HH310_29830 [Actinoplanes sp. TBRC 11911]|uniref:hypothetical protein n=1 Tax=Actinoplanes sp. TBRC 11911 TaxID=2729386 RepID=UPI00145F3EBC|nr:hypothetical protein [Actinoplanes sp. TBRC 11911]NMO55370.1 hypothetical protein [Actinoplanes sp. TBRC 11911]
MRFLSVEEGGIVPVPGERPDVVWLPSARTVGVPRPATAAPSDKDVPGRRTAVGWSFLDEPGIDDGPLLAGFVVEVRVEASVFRVGAQLLAPGSLARMIAAVRSPIPQPIVVLTGGSVVSEETAELLFGGLADALRTPVFTADAEVHSTVTGLLRTMGAFHQWSPRRGDTPRVRVVGDVLPPVPARPSRRAGAIDGRPVTTMVEPVVLGPQVAVLLAPQRWLEMSEIPAVGWPALPRRRKAQPEAFPTTAMILSDDTGVIAMPQRATANVPQARPAVGVVRVSGDARAGTPTGVIYGTAETSPDPHAEPPADGVFGRTRVPLLPPSNVVALPALRKPKGDEDPSPVPAADPMPASLMVPAPTVVSVTVKQAPAPLAEPTPVQATGPIPRVAPAPLRAAEPAPPAESVSADPEPGPTPAPIGVSVTPLPPTGSPRWLTEADIDQAVIDRTALRLALEGRYDAHARVVSRTLAESPGLRASIGAFADLATGLVGVRAYHAEERDVVNQALRGAGSADDAERVLVLARCAAYGLRRLPVVLGPVFRAGPADVELIRGYRPGDVLTEPAFIDVDLAAGPVAPGVEYAVWSVSAHRLDGLGSGAAGTAIFEPGSRFKVLAVDDRTSSEEPVRVLLQDLTGRASSSERILARLRAVSRTGKGGGRLSFAPGLDDAGRPFLPPKVYET